MCNTLQNPPQNTPDVSATVKTASLVHVYIERQWKSSGMQKCVLCERPLTVQSVLKAHLDDKERPDIIKFLSFSSGTIILLEKYLTTYLCVQVALNRHSIYGLKSNCPRDS